MSDVMLLGVLRMPYELAMSDELSRWQFWEMAQGAADRIERDAYEITRLRAEVEALRGDASRWRAVEAADSGLTLRLHNTRPDERRATIDSALKEHKNGR